MPEGRQQLVQGGKVAGKSRKGVPNPKVSRYMTENNPMRNPDTRAKVSATLQAIGHRPKVRGGNGHGLTVPQQKLLDALPAGWVAEHVVPVGPPTRGGPPSHYKIDLAYPALKVAVEVDGGSHGALSRQEQDKRKGTWLSSHGWLVYRFSNQEVLSSTSSVIAQITSTRSQSTRRRTRT
jgi:hypothetical protein